MDTKKEDATVTNTKHTPDDGRYYAKYGAVHKAPIATKNDDGGQSITLGFPVCTMTDCVGDDAAEAVAGLMNRGEIMPELLEALKEAEAMFRWYGDLHQFKESPATEKAIRNYDMADKLDAVIAKAEGRTNG